MMHVDVCIDGLEEMEREAVNDELFLLQKMCF